MKTRAFFSIVTALLLSVLMAACTKELKTTPTPVEPWTEEKLDSALGSHLWRVETMFETVGSTTVEIKGSFNDTYKALPFIFWQGNVFYYSGFLFSKPNVNSPFPPEVETMGAATRIRYPTGLTYEWDGARNTIVIKSGTSPSVGTLIPPNKTAVLDQDSFRLYNTVDEAQSATVHENVTLTVEDTDPQMGKIIYTYNLKPLWQYGGAGDLNYTYYYGIF